MRQLCVSSFSPFVSAESDGQLVYPINARFILNDFWSYIQCYMFFCKLADHVGGEVEKVFQEWETENGKLSFLERGRDALAKSASHPGSSSDEDEAPAMCPTPPHLAPYE